MKVALQLNCRTELRNDDAPAAPRKLSRLLQKVGRIVGIASAVASAVAAIGRKPFDLELRRSRERLWNG